MDVYQRSEAEPSTVSKVVDGIQSTAERVSEAGSHQDELALMRMALRSAPAV